LRYLTKIKFCKEQQFIGFKGLKMYFEISLKIACTQ
jgi:hypothetical protein